MATDDESFIGRWSRRKTQVSTPGGLKKKSSEVAEPVRGRMITDPLPVAPQEPEEVSDTAEKNVEVAALKDDGQNAVPLDEETNAEDGELDISELEQIDIEALDYDADFTRFMQAGVPERLRQRALRRLWSTNPILANVDGLNDYDEDFTDAALAVDTLKTAWKVGQGYLTDVEVEERDADRLADQTGADVEGTAESAEIENDAPEAITIADPDSTDQELDSVADQRAIDPEMTDDSEVGGTQPVDADLDPDPVSSS